MTPCRQEKNNSVTCAKEVKEASLQQSRKLRGHWQESEFLDDHAEVLQPKSPHARPPNNRSLPLAWAFQVASLPGCKRSRPETGSDAICGKWGNGEIRIVLLYCALQFTSKVQGGQDVSEGGGPHRVGFQKNHCQLPWDFLDKYVVLLPAVRCTRHHVGYQGVKTEHRGPSLLEHSSCQLRESSGEN